LGTSSYICTSNQDLPKSISLWKREVVIEVGIKISFGHIVGLSHCLLLPNGLKNIVSAPLQFKEGYEFSFRDNKHQIYYHNKLVSTALLVNGLYYLDNKPMMNAITNKYARDILNPKQL
jgi:hypothetical protein